MIQAAPWSTATFKATVAAASADERSTAFGRMVLASLLVVTLAGCGQPNAYQAPPPPEVNVVHPLQQSVTSYVEQTGSTQASERVELRARVAGFLVERNFEDGDLVKKGQLLFVIDEEPFKVKLQHAKAKEAEAEANVRKAELSKRQEIAKAQLSQRQSEQQLAKMNHDRLTDLIGRNATSRQEFDTAEASLRTAAALLLVAQAEVEQAEVSFETDILSAQAALKLAQADVQTAEIDLGYCRITAPLDGRIDRRAFDIGNYVTADSTTPLGSIVRVDPIYAYAAINEEELVQIKTRYPGEPGENGKIPVRMAIGEDRSFPFEGTIDYIAPTVQTGTGTVQIRGLFKNNGVVLPGMFIRLRIPSEDHPDAILVSERSLGYDQAGTYVYVVNSEDTIERRLVTPGDVIESYRVVEGDLKAGDRVVADGLLKVRPGMKVTPKLKTESAQPEAVSGSEVSKAESHHAR